MKSFQRSAGPPSDFVLDLGDATAPLKLRVDRRARRVIVRVDPTGRIVVTAPSHRATPDALAFARSRVAWIKAQIDRHGPQPFAPGVVMPFEGRPTAIVHAPTLRGVSLAPGALQVGGDVAHLNRRLSDWLKQEARRKLTERVEAHVEKLGRKRGRIAVRDTASRWGSCSESGALSFSWRLILAPPEMLDYVAAHECAHLVHMNHSPCFWGLVRDLGADAAAARDWFARNGQALHRWGRLKAA